MTPEAKYILEPIEQRGQTEMFPIDLMTLDDRADEALTVHYPVKFPHKPQSPLATVTKVTVRLLG